MTTRDSEHDIMASEEPIERPQLTLRLLPERLAICQLHRDAPFPTWACRGDFYSLTLTPNELSIVCAEENVPADLPCDAGWRVLSSPGPWGFTLTGLVESLAEPLALAGISIFVVSTYTTDYVMVKQNDLNIAMVTLKAAGHIVQV